MPKAFPFAPARPKPQDFELAGPLSDNLVSQALAFADSSHEHFNFTSVNCGRSLLVFSAPPVPLAVLMSLVSKLSPRIGKSLGGWGKDKRVPHKDLSRSR